MIQNIDDKYQEKSEIEISIEKLKRSLKFINDENKKYNNVNEKQYQNNVRTNLKTDV